MFYKDKLVLVTGGSGFVGTHIVEELLKQGAKVRVPIHNRPMIVKDSRIETVKADLVSADDCLRAVTGVDYIFHAAGAVAAAAVTTSNPMEAIIANLLLTSRVLQAAWSANTERVLVFSSSTGYPDAGHPIKEEEMWNAPPPPVYYGYGWMRRYLEVLSEYVCAKSKTKVAIMRPTAVYGRHDNFTTGTSHVIPALIKRALSKEDPYVVWGTGNEVRDFLHITDLAKGCLLLLEKDADCDPVNVGSGKGITIKETVNIILKLTGHNKAKLVFDASKPTTIPYRVADISKAGRVLGFRPSVPIEEGLKDTIEWYLEHSKK